MVKLNTLFKIEKGKSYFKDFTVADDGINYITTSGKNNGIKCKVLENSNYKIYPGGTITIAMQGSILSSFLQQEPFYLQTHVAALVPIDEMSLNEKLFYIWAISSNAYKYSFGRKANGTLKTLEVPSRSEIPSFIFKKDIPDISSVPDYFLEEGYDKASWYLDNVNHRVFEEKYRPKHNNKLFDIKTSDWHDFKIMDIFDLITNKRITSSNLEDGETRFISAKASNNGLRQYVNLEPIHKGNCITVNYDGSGVGEAFYQVKPFCASDSVYVLKPKKWWVLNPYVGMFLSTIIRTEKFKYSFGRKWSSVKMKNTKIKLPILKNPDGSFAKDKNGNLIPDWKFMEDYIKSLSYSKNL